MKMRILLRYNVCLVFPWIYVNFQLEDFIHPHNSKAEYTDSRSPALTYYKNFRHVHSHMSNIYCYPRCHFYHFCLFFLAFENAHCILSVTSKVCCYLCACKWDNRLFSWLYDDLFKVFETCVYSINMPWLYNITYQGNETLERWITKCVWWSSLKENHKSFSCRLKRILSQKLN